ncbi:MAG: TolC family protein [Planctomycetota bacterium]
MGGLERRGEPGSSEERRSLSGRQRREATRLRWGLVLVAVALGLGTVSTGCAARFERAANVEGRKIQREKSAEVEEFRRTSLVDPEVDPAQRRRRAAPTDVPPVLTLTESIRIATEYNRDYQIERETLFINALGLGVIRRDFLRPVFSGSASYVRSDGKSRSYSDVASLSLGGTQLFRTGGRLTVDADASISRDPIEGGADQSVRAGAAASFTQPLLRGAGEEIAFEALTQAERELLYDARAFEQFRQSFVIGVIDDYYGLVVQKKQLENQRERIVQQARSVEQAKALFQAGRGSKLDVFRADQSLLGARSSVLAAEQSYRFSLDRFKVLLGLPIDQTIDVADEIPEPKIFEIDVEKALAAAIHNRLDLATQRDRLEDRERGVRIARNGLLPDLDVGVSYGFESEIGTSFRGLDYYDNDFVTLSANLEIPLDRRRERNTYRVSLISLAQSRRALEQAEDNVIVDVRDAVRRLERSRQQIELGIEEIKSFEQSVEKAQIDLEAGRVTNRDLVEAQDDLTAARNDQLERKASYEVNRLELIRVVGLLFVDPDGQVEE